MNSADDIESRLGAITNYLRLSPDLATAGQPTRKQFEVLSAAVFRTVINLALTTSTNALPDEREIVERHGMEYVHIPVGWGGGGGVGVFLVCRWMSGLGVVVWVVG